MRLKNKFLTYLFFLCSTLSIFQNIKPIGGNDSGVQEFRDGIIIDNKPGDQVNHTENVLADVGSGLLRMADDLDEGQLDLKYSLTNLGMTIFDIGRANQVFFPLAELEMMRLANKSGKSRGRGDPLSLHLKRTLDRWQNCKDDPKKYFKESLVNLAESTDKISKVLSPLFAEECVNDLMEEGFVEESAKAALIYQQQTKETVEKLKIVLNHIHSLPGDEKFVLLLDLILPDSPEDVATFALSRFFKGARKLARIARNAEPIIQEVKKLSVIEKELMFLGRQADGKLKVSTVTNSDFNLGKKIQSKVKGQLLQKQNGLPLVTMKSISIAEENFKKFASEISKIIPEVPENLLFQLLREAVPTNGEARVFQKEVDLGDYVVKFRRDIGKGRAHKILPDYPDLVDHFNIDVCKKTSRGNINDYYKYHIIVDKDLNVVDDFGKYVGNYKKKNKGKIFSITRDLQIPLNENIGNVKNGLEAVNPKPSSVVGVVANGSMLGDLAAADAVGLLCRDEGIKDLEMGEDGDNNEFSGESIFTQTKHLFVDPDNSEPLINKTDLFADPEVNDDKNPSDKINSTKKSLEDDKDKLKPIIILANPQQDF